MMGGGIFLPHLLFVVALGILSRTEAQDFIYTYEQQSEPPPASPAFDPANYVVNSPSVVQQNFIGAPPDSYQPPPPSPPATTRKPRRNNPDRRRRVQYVADPPEQYDQSVATPSQHDRRQEQEYYRSYEYSRYQPPLTVQGFEEDQEEAAGFDEGDYFAETTSFAKPSTPRMHPFTTTTTTSTTTTTTTRRPSRRAKVRTTTTTTRRPRVQSYKPPKEVENPVVLKDDDQVECFKRGIYSHPEDCSRFVVCGPNGKTGSELKGRILNCPAGQIFFEDIGRCTRGDRVKCEKSRK